MTSWIPLGERFLHHRELVSIVRSAGVEPPARWDEVDSRLNGFLAMESSSTRQLAEYVANPRDDHEVDVHLLRSLALAEESAHAGAEAALRTAVVAAVHREMLAAYQPVAENIYDAVAKKFNTAAAAFHAAAKVVDPESAPGTVVRFEDKQRNAWLAAEVEAATLDALVPPLLAAVQLTGVRIDTADDQRAQPWWQAPIDDCAAFALTVDAGSVHRRRAWTAYDNTDGRRCGRWSALAAAGCTIRAPKLGDYQPYRRPLPIQYRQEQVIGQPRGTVRQVAHDPEDEQPTPQPIEPVRIS